MALKLHSLKDNKFASAVSDCILDKADQCISDSGGFKIVLSGGKTPVNIFHELVRKQSRVDWRKIEIYWVDERCVPIDSHDSNYGTCKKHLIDNLRVKPVAYPMYYSGAPQDAALKYENLLKQKFKLEEKFKFDLVLLGVGTDGHVASIFPGSGELTETRRWVVPTISPFQPKERVSLTFSVMNSTSNCLVIAKGSEKKWVYDACVKNNSDLTIPACNVNPVSGNIDWFISFE